MNRAAVRAFRRTTTISTVRTLSRTTRRGFFSSAVQLAAKAHRPLAAGHAPLRSSMYFRRLPVALVSSLVVGYGAWYSYNNSNLASSPGVSRSLTSSAATADALPTRTVLVVGADELRQGTIVGEGPILKQTSDDGRRIVEMLTPDQATQKLRKLEQSFSVNRGQGVTRYDLVQLPSNDPIEDDHAEKIVQVPSRGVEGNSDWMFWGVFDGHSLVYTAMTLRLRWDTNEMQGMDYVCDSEGEPYQLCGTRA